MIKNINSDFTGRIATLDFEADKLQLEITVRVATVANSNDTNNIGTILEKYRSLNSGNEDYFLERKSLLEDFIRAFKSPYKDLSPDCIVCFYRPTKTEELCWNPLEIK